MKKSVLLLALLIFLTGCASVKESMREPVDAEDTTPIALTIASDMSVSELGDWLNDNRLVASKGAFIDYMKEYDLTGRMQAGDFVLSRSMSLSEIAAKITEPPQVAETVTITIPEGKENREIAMIFEEAGLFTAEEFLTALEEETFDYSFLEGLDREFGYEGYLFPDTYEFYADTTPRSVISRMLANFDQRFTSAMREQAAAKGMSIDDVVRLASIVEREAANPIEFGLISSVFHNRLDIGMMLQSCATVQFILEERVVNLTYAQMAIESPYNTYIIEGLPPSAIANPGLLAIESAINPDESDYLFFVAKGDGENTHYFARTYEEHQENIARSGDL